MEIVIGTKKWSSWSLRPWLALKHTGEPFIETLVRLRHAETSEVEIARHSPSKLVPVLKDGDITVWDSLAICEYLAEKFPAAKLWPDDPTARALGRSAAAEMHSGFAALRSECPMELDTRKVMDISEATRKNVRRIVELWRGMRDRFGDGGPYLFGEWSVPDAFFTPVAARIRHFQLDLAIHGDDGTAQAYADTLLDHPDFRQWEAEALA